MTPHPKDDGPAPTRSRRCWLLAATLCASCFDGAGARSLDDVPLVAASRRPLWIEPSATGLSPRDHVTTTLLHDGTLLVVAGYTTDGVATAERYDPETGQVLALPPLRQARWFHSAVMLRSGQVMVLAGKVPAGGSTATTELFDPVSRSWSDGPPLTRARERQTATVLWDGRVLVAGTWGGVAPFDELYDPSLGAWRSLDAGMLTTRGEHTATRLADGRVLVAGGLNNAVGDVLTSAELFDPVTLTWADAGSFPGKRFQHAASLLPDGRVLVAGGVDGPSATSPTPLDTAAIFDPATGGWTATATRMLDQRVGGTANLLPSGLVLLAAGGQGAATSELFDPDAGTFTDAGRHTVRWSQQEVVLPTGEVALVMGQDNVGFLGTVSFYYPAAPRWASVQDLPNPQANAASVLLPDGQVLVVGDGAATFDPLTDRWTVTPAPSTTRSGHTASLLHDGRVLVAGAGAPCELYEPTSRTWTPTGALSTGRTGHTATVLGDGRVLVAGGTGTQVGAPVLDTAELFDPTSGTWQPAASLPAPRAGHFATLLRDGRVLVVGGSTTPGSAALYEPARDRWVAVASPSAQHAEPVGALLPSGRVAMLGATSAEEYDPGADTWTLGDSLPSSVSGAAGAVTFSGKFVVAGGRDAGVAQAQALLYTPRTRALEPLPPSPVARAEHTVSRLLDGRLLFAGGRGATGSAVPSSHTFEDVAAPFKRPVLAALPQPLVPGASVPVRGSGWVRVAQATSGRYDISASDTPLLRLERVDNGEVHYARLTGWTDTDGTAELPGAMNPGWYVARLIVAGASSVGRAVSVLPAASPADGGVDGGGGTSDAGVDAGSGSSDGGVDPVPVRLTVGCGCGAGGGAPLFLALGLLWAARGGSCSWWSPRRRRERGRPDQLR